MPNGTQYIAPVVKVSIKLNRKTNEMPLNVCSFSTEAGMNDTPIKTRVVTATGINEVRKPKRK